MSVLSIIASRIPKTCTISHEAVPAIHFRDWLCASMRQAPVNMYFRARTHVTLCNPSTRLLLKLTRGGLSKLISFGDAKMKRKQYATKQRSYNLQLSSTNIYGLRLWICCLSTSKISPRLLISDVWPLLWICFTKGTQHKRLQKTCWAPNWTTFD